MNLWNSLKSYFSPERRLNESCDNGRCTTLDRFGGLLDRRFPETQFSIISQMFDVNEFAKSFDDIFHRIEQDFQHGSGQFYENKSPNANEYYYQNKDDTNGTFFSYYKVEMGPGSFPMPRAEFSPGHEQLPPEKYRDILIKPEFRNKSSLNDNARDISLDGSVSIEDIRRKFFK